MGGRPSQLNRTKSHQTSVSPGPGQKNTRAGAQKSDNVHVSAERGVMSHTLSEEEMHSAVLNTGGFADKSAESSPGQGIDEERSGAGAAARDQDTTVLRAGHTVAD